LVPSKLNELSGVAFVLAGISIALWTLVHPWGSFAGAEVGQSSQWVASHTFHFLAAVFGGFGFLGLVDREVTRASSFERAGFLVAFLGVLVFAGTGVITAFVWPILARLAPSVVAVDGPFFQPPHPVIVASIVTYFGGHLLLGIALLRAGAVSIWVGACVIAGALLLAVPPAPLSPIPWPVFPLGGVVFGLGLVGIGLGLRSGFAIGAQEVEAGVSG